MSRIITRADIMERAKEINRREGKAWADALRQAHSEARQAEAANSEATHCRRLGAAADHLAELE